MNAPLLQLEDVTRQYPLPRERLWQKPALVHALRGVSLHLQSGRSLGHGRCFAHGLLLLAGMKTMPSFKVTG